MIQNVTIREKSNDTTEHLSGKTKSVVDQTLRIPESKGSHWFLAVVPRKLGG